MFVNVKGVTETGMPQAAAAEQAATRLEDLTPGARVRGVVATRSVAVVQSRWHGTEAITLTYRDDEGNVGERLLFRDDEPSLELEAESRAWAFDADGKLFRLVSEALRIRLAYLFDPLLAVHTSNLEPLPHQIQAVYGELLPRQPLRFLLADDPGAGKTIMAGLFIKELIVRGDVKRCLVVAPGSLVEQWQDELWQKLGLDFEIITRETIEASKTGNPYAEKSLVISRLDHLSRNDELQEKLKLTDWDLVVVDEAHKMSAHYFGAELKETRRYRLGRLLGSVTRHLLLMTATPHSGKEADFQLFMALLDSDRFEGRYRDGVHSTDTTGLMRRMVKEKLVKFDGRPLFPERRAYSVEYDLSDAEAHLYQQVTDYVREEMNRAERLREAGEGRRGTIVGFALTTLQRRLASSPEAIYRSLQRRRKRLEDRVREEELRKRGLEARIDTLVGLEELDQEDIEEIDDRPDAEVEEIEEEVVDQASAAQTIAELRAEIDTLGRLEELARKVRSTGTDRKWEELSRLLQGESEMYEASGGRRKLIIFSEHRDTLNYLTERIRTLLGRAESVVTIHGGMGREDRRKAQELFIQDKDTVVLVATDAAGEGINLQRAHLLVNYDLPWNPNRIEQRFGRIHRIGQTEVCHMWNLVAVETREGEVFKRLLDKLNAMREALGGQVFDVLGSGRIFRERSLRDLLIEAVRYGEEPEVRAKLEQVVEQVFEDELREALSERALVTDALSPSDIDEIRGQMERAEARKLQPHFIRSFFLEAFAHLGGRISEREPGRYEITHVPADVRGRDRLIGVGAPLLRRYERVTFEKTLVAPIGQPLAELLAPGHPLLDATVDLILERHRELLKQGAILVADADSSESPRALVYLEHAIEDGRPDRSGNRRVVSKQLQFVEVQEAGQAQVAGYAPYLDYRPLADGEHDLLEPLLDGAWLSDEIEAKGHDYAVASIVPDHLAEVRRRTVSRVNKTIAAVKDRLTKEITYWDHRANELEVQERAGKQPKLNSAKARERADELQARLKRRLDELEHEKQLAPLPPVVIGGALVVPAGLLERVRGERTAEPAAYARDTERVERLAVDAVLAHERALGREPLEMPRNNPGYDVLSKDPGSGEFLFIEVKGRVEGAPTVTVTRNEILTALNKPAQYVLALVEVSDRDETDVQYLREPFAGSEDAFFDVTSVNYNWQKLTTRAAAPA
jgi:superfamily II DNA or RNA helicase